MSRGALRVAAAVLSALLLGWGCAPRSGLFPLPGERGLTGPVGDDLSWEGLEQAVERSIGYYRRVPGALFRYGDLTYTAAEMEASMRLFLDIVEGFEGEERERRIRGSFLFFESRNDEGRAFFTGYYEPLLEGSTVPGEGFSVPLYAVPGDLVTVPLDPYVEMGLLPPDIENRTLRGKLQGKRVVPYDSREEISYRSSLEGRAEVLVYLRDHVELAFLQIQGSGVVRLPGGALRRLNYADQNGHPYRPIGRLLLDRIPREEMSLQRIREHLYAHPGEVREILSYNPSYIFFRPVEEGPLGSIGVPLTAGRSVAMDGRLLPRGGLAYIETRYPLPASPGGVRDRPAPIRRFAVVQDTGGAIRGHGRVDVFWGSGEEGERIAGPMKEPGRVWLLVARKELLAEPPGPQKSRMRRDSTQPSGASEPARRQ